MLLSPKLGCHLVPNGYLHKVFNEIQFPIFSAGLYLFYILEVTIIDTLMLMVVLAGGRPKWIGVILKPLRSLKGTVHSNVLICLVCNFISPN